MGEGSLTEDDIKVLLGEDNVTRLLNNESESKDLYGTLDAYVEELELQNAKLLEENRILKNKNISLIPVENFVNFLNELSERVGNLEERISRLDGEYK